MGEFLKGPWGSALRVFLGVVAAGFYTWLQNGNSFTDIDLDAVVGFVNAALIVVVPLAIAALNPADDRFGRVAPPAE
jgi:hypothetical protein